MKLAQTERTHNRKPPKQRSSKSSSKNKSKRTKSARRKSTNKSAAKNKDPKPNEKVNIADQLRELRSTISRLKSTPITERNNGPSTLLNPLQDYQSEDDQTSVSQNSYHDNQENNIDHFKSGIQGDISFQRSDIFDQNESPSYKGDIIEEEVQLDFLEGSKGITVRAQTTDRMRVREYLDTVKNLEIAAGPKTTRPISRKTVRPPISQRNSKFSKVESQIEDIRASFRKAKQNFIERSTFKRSSMTSSSPSLGFRNTNGAESNLGESNYLEGQGSRYSKGMERSREPVVDSIQEYSHRIREPNNVNIRHSEKRSKSNRNWFREEQSLVVDDRQPNRNINGSTLPNIPHDNNNSSNIQNQRAVPPSQNSIQVNEYHSSPYRDKIQEEEDNKDANVIQRYSTSTSSSENSERLTDKVNKFVKYGDMRDRIYSLEVEKKILLKKNIILKSYIHHEREPSPHKVLPLPDRCRLKYNRLLRKRVNQGANLLVCSLLKQKRSIRHP